MSNPLSKALLDQQGKPVQLITCTVTSITPLLVTIGGTTSIPAVSVGTPALGFANALLVDGSKPIVLQAQ